MAQINISQLSFHYDTHEENIFNNVSFSIDTNWKLGLIGRNGRGKTTFLHLLMGRYTYSGKIISPVSFDYFPVTVENKEQVALEVVRMAISPFTQMEEQLAGYLSCPDKLALYGEILEKYVEQDGYIINEMIEKEVRKMQMDPEILTRKFETLSYGEQTKLLLIALFLKKNNFLLIDEPTNHLDVEGRKCVAKYLSGKKGFIIISHDRTFLDGMIDHVLSINKANIEIQKGNFSTWEVNKGRQDGFEKAENEKLKKDIKRLQDAAKQKANWSHLTEATKFGSGSTDRGHIGHKAAKMMKRAKCIEARQNKAIVEKSKLLKNLEEVAGLTLTTLEDTPKELLEVQQLQVHYDNHMLFNPINLTIHQGERIWLRGKNGCGKSSLIKVLMGEDIPYSGSVNCQAKIAYVSQDTSYLKGSLADFSLAEAVDRGQLENILYKLGFNTIQLEKELSKWSEGQKKKLLIAKSLCQPAHIYIWDEPLNFIDVISRIQIENLILSEQPTILFVEHDQFFGERVATRILDIV